MNAMESKLLKEYYEEKKFVEIQSGDNNKEMKTIDYLNEKEIKRRENIVNKLPQDKKDNCKKCLQDQKEMVRIRDRSQSCYVINGKPEEKSYGLVWECYEGIRLTLLNETGKYELIVGGKIIKE